MFFEKEAQDENKLWHDDKFKLPRRGSPGAEMIQHYDMLVLSWAANATLGSTYLSVNTAKIATCRIMLELANQRDGKICVWMLSNLSNSPHLGNAQYGYFTVVSAVVALLVSQLLDV